MRYIFLLIMVGLSHILHAQELSDIRVSYVQKDVRLQEVFKALEAQYGIRFSYATTSIERDVLDVDFENASIESVLDFLLENRSMEYKIISNNILLRKADTYEAIKNDSYDASLHLTGRVTRIDNEALDFATISVSNSTIGTFSDENGNFDIEIPKEYQNEKIVVQYLGYEDEVYTISELEDTYLMVAMQDGPVSIDEVMIVNKEKPLKLGGLSGKITLNSTQIKSNTSSIMGNDISRQIQLLPGIAAHEDNSAAIKIRGSNSDETLIVLDGMPIYNANHYYGIFSGVNAAFVDSVNIFKNMYPFQYGGRTGGLVELFSKTSHPARTSANLALDLMTASADLAIPLSKNSNVSIAGRSTIRAVNNQQFNTVNSPAQESLQIESFSQKVEDKRSDPTFTFYDLNAKYQYRSKNDDVFSINFFRSSDQVENRYRIEVKDAAENELNLIAIDDQRWSNTAASVQFTKRIKPSFQINTTAYYTEYYNEEINAFRLDKKNKKGDPPPPNNPLNANLGSTQQNEIRDISMDSHLLWKRKNGTLKFGLMATHHDINYSFRENEKLKLRGNTAFYEWAGYSAYSFRLWDKLDAVAGLRATYFTNVKSIQYSPRTLLNYQLTSNFALKTSFTIENQVIRQLYYEYRGEPMELWVNAGNNGIPILRSDNIMIGSTFRLPLFTIDVEVYRKDRKGQLEYFLPNPSDPSNNAEQNREYQLLRGDGLVRGIDVIISSGYKSYDTYVSYTLSRSEQRFKEIFLNNYFASENDRTHQFKWVNTLSTGNFTWGLNTIYVSGRPYTDIRNVDQGGDLRNLNPDSRLRRVKPYYRMDISAAYAFKIGKREASLFASIFNLMNRNNVQYIQSVSTQVNAEDKLKNIIVGNESELLNRTVNVGVQIGF